MVDNDAGGSLWEASVEGSQYRPIKVWSKAISSVAELLTTQKSSCWDFPGSAVVQNLPANAGDTGSSPGPGRSHMPWSN